MKQRSRHKYPEKKTRLKHNIIPRDVQKIPIQAEPVVGSKNKRSKVRIAKILREVVERRC